MPLKEYYFHNPKQFDPQDANLSEKAHRYKQNMREIGERFKEDNDRNLILKSIFKEVELQRSKINNDI